MFTKGDGAKGAVKEYDFINRSTLKPPNRFTCSGRYLILVKGTQGHYILWQTQDRLLDNDEGASKWIKVFEEETVGKILALGDLKEFWGYPKW